MATCRKPNYMPLKKEIRELGEKIAYHRKQPEPKKLDFELLRYTWALDYVDGMKMQHAEYVDDVKRKCIVELMKEAEKYIDFYKLPPGNRYEANIYVAKRNFHN